MKEVNGVLSELSEAESTVQTRQISQLQSSFQSFDAEVDSLKAKSSSASQQLGEAAASLRARAAGLLEAHALIGREAACP